MQENGIAGPSIDQIRVMIVQKWITREKKGVSGGANFYLNSSSNQNATVTEAKVAPKEVENQNLSSSSRSTLKVLGKESEVLGPSAKRRKVEVSENTTNTSSTKLEKSVPVHKNDNQKSDDPNDPDPEPPGKKSNWEQYGKARRERKRQQQQERQKLEEA